MRIVVDASVATKWFVPETDSASAMQLLDHSYDLYAPRLLASEVANTLWRKANSGSLDNYQAARMAAAVTDLPLTWMDDEATCAEALRIALEIGHPAYDCTYLALALRIGARMITANKRFVTAVAATEYKPAVVLLWDLNGPDAHGLVQMRAS